MRSLFSASAALLALAGTALSAAPADARWYGGYGGYGGGFYHHHHGGGAGLAVGAGLLGLAAGAAIASRPYYRAPAYGYGYAPDYGYAPGYAYAPGYYAPPPPPPPAYGYYRPCGRWSYYHGYC